jgi:3-oxoacyl-[acyl-carrier-protein] synthase II
MKRRVVVTGLGVVCSQGQSPEKVFHAWCNGESGIAMHTVGEAPFSITLPLSICTDFDGAATLGKSRLTTMDRVSQLSAVAALNAWSDAGLDQLPEEHREQACVLWGSSTGGLQTIERGYRELFIKERKRISPLSVILSMTNASASHIAMRLGLGGDCISYAMACASSSVALGEAFRRIQYGQADVIVSGGAEAMMPFGSLKAWESMQVMAPSADNVADSCKPFHAHRRGLVIGEGAAGFILEEYEHAKKRGAKMYAELIGYGSSCDHAHLTAPDKLGQLRALKGMLKDAEINASDIDYVNAHGTATLEGDPTEIASLVSLLGDHAAKTMVSSTKSMHGHLLGGAGAIECLSTVLSLQTKSIPPTAHLTEVDPACLGVDHVQQSGRSGVKIRTALTNSFAFGGSNAVLALRSLS